MSQRLQLKMLLDDITQNADRRELCLLLATLLAWTSVVRAILYGSTPSEAAPERHFSLPQRKDSECDELEDDLADEEGL